MSEPLTLAFLLWSGQVGGAERHTVALASTIRAQGLADAHVIFIDAADPVASQMAAEGYDVPFAELRLGRGRNILLHPARLMRAVKETRAEVVFVPHEGPVAAVIRGFGFHGGLVGVSHGAWLNPETLRRARRGIHELALHAAEPLFDAVVGVSPVMTDLLFRQHGSRVRIFTIPNGVDVERFRPPAGTRRPQGDGFRIGVAGRLVHGKGVREAVLALRPEVAGRPAHLRIAGDGPLRSELEQLAERRGLTRHVEFLGRVDDMVGFWQDCDVAVHAANGLVESFCLAAVEAQACGLPAVVTRSGALPTVVADGETGTVVEPGDIEGLWNAIAMYATDNALCEAQGRAARRRALRLYDLRRVACEYVATACEVLERQGTLCTPEATAVREHAGT